MSEPAAAPVAPPSPDAPRRGSDLARLARWTGEYLSVVTALSFLLAVIANQFVFKLWGLGFLQVATLPDVVTSGLTLLLYGLIPLSLAFSFAFGVAKLRGPAGWLKWILALGALVLCLLAAVAIWFTEGGSLLTMLGGVLFVGLLLPSALHARRHPSRRGAVRQMLAAFFGLVTASSLVHATVARYATGYGGSRAQLLSASPALRDCAGFVLWSGERALVLSCSPLRRFERPKRVVVIYEPQNWVFRVEPRLPPLEPGASGLESSAPRVSGAPSTSRQDGPSAPRPIR